MATIPRWITLAQVCLIAMVAISPCYGQIKPVAPNQEYKSKAKYLFNFAKFTAWPRDILAAGDPLRLCILGTDPFGLFLDILAIRDIRGHQVDLRRLKSRDQARDCHLLFLAADAVLDQGRVPAELSRRGLLVIADRPGLAAYGATASLFLEDDGKVRFEINVTAARRAALILNTQLLQLGRLTDNMDGDRP